MTTHDADRGGRLPRIIVRPGLAVAVAIVTALLGWLTLPVAVPDRPTSSYLSAGLLGAILLVAILLAADLMRARAARRNGVTVAGIMLGALGSRLLIARPRRWSGGVDTDPTRAIPWVGGGAATPIDPTAQRGEAGQTSPVSPKADGAIARAGLLTTGLLGAALVVLGVFLPGDTLALAGQVLLWVGTFTLLITLVDLLPTPRSPGGRVLASLVRRRGGDESRAEAVVARVGVVTGWTLIAIGVAACFVVGLIGLWAVLLGWMTLGASRLAQVQQRATTALDGVFVRDVMSPPPPRLSSWQTVGAALDEVALPSRQSVFTVHEFDGTLSGIAALRALAAIPMDDRTLARVSRVTIPLSAVATARPDEPLAAVTPRLATHPSAGVILVVSEDDKGRPTPVGLVEPQDITRAIETAPLRGRTIAPSGLGRFGR
ncbi:MAG: peptidase M50 [Frankia sp.]|nr:peptidase M50 [Frankia sp.]